MGFSTRRKPTNTTERRLHRLLSGLPPTKFSIPQRHLHPNYSLRPNIHLGSAPATTMSWLPPPPRRCGGPPRLPQLRLVTAGPPENPSPRGHYLADLGSILEIALERGEVSYWSLLERFDGKKAEVAAAPSQPSDPLRREMRLSWARLDAGSGINVSYWVVMDPEALRSLSWRRQSMYRQAVTVRYECAVSDPFDARSKPMEFAAMTRFGSGRKKLYGVSLQGAVAEMEVVGTHLRITGVGGTTRGVPTSRSRFFKEYLVEREGEILLVFLIHHESVEVVDDVEILRLNSTRLDWIKVEELRGKAMFLKESGCEWVESAEFGCRDNCVFFTEGKENKWRVYDFKKCCISSVL